MAAVDLYRALWRHRLLIIALTALIGGVAWYVTTLQPKIYEATALVRVQQKITAGDVFGSLETGTRLAQTYAEIVATQSLKRRVSQALGGTVKRDEIQISAKPVTDLELLQISARSESPAQAALMANAATVALRAFIKDNGTLRDQVIVVDPASVPTTFVSPRVKLTVALAVLLGLLLNCALALVADYLADPLPEHAAMEPAFGLPVLGAIPPLSFPKTTVIRAPAPGQLDGGQARAPAVGSERVREGGL
jgi:succinoglycan biosynthesis transport protein ExoP